MFKGLINLETLKLCENQITLLNVDLFNETRILQNLSLYQNKLTSLPSGMFKGLINLETLKLSGNKINSLKVDLFNEPRKLENLRLRHDKLTSLPSVLLKDSERR